MTWRSENAILPKMRKSGVAWTAELSDARAHNLLNLAGSSLNSTVSETTNIEEKETIPELNSE